jgi:predicted nucleotidyltransferase
MGIHIQISQEQIAEFCRHNHIRSFAFFGSVLRDDFRPDSDVDVLVEFEEGQEPRLTKLVDMQEELSELLGKKADLVERKAIEQSENYIRRRHILKSVETVYVAG